MNAYAQKSKDELNGQLTALLSEYEVFKNEGHSLDISRGKPCKEQLDLSVGMMDTLSSKSSLNAQNGFDCRNYGIIDGIEEAKELFSQLFDVAKSEIVIGGNSSLGMMYDAMIRAILFGVSEDAKPWGEQGEVKFVCPSPGYDRHFHLCEELGIKMIPVGMDENGPDMDAVRKIVESDESVKGMWCVPKFSNPTGVVYSDEVVRAIAALKPAAKDFRVFWDNAYAVHDLYERVELLSLLDECKKAGNADMVYMFGSTSKVSFAGSGIAILAASEANIAHAKSHMKFQTIGSDKLNQLRHVRFFKNTDGVYAHMKKHAQVIGTKFDIVDDILTERVGKSELAEWIKPKGGYFISLDVKYGSAKKVVGMMKDAGIMITPAGVTFPYGDDPRDSNIRIAPTFTGNDALSLAMKTLCLCINIVSIEDALKGK
ncbi:MAG: aminotransferase class I/II-fold pyridoxal phosphate-dependent enzyme [Clostridia bacterium]|jgi:aspartate/methionine/tyrosine aminotransferase|nr:aminotransferase class I/II-fold pyridoxal phosphate-dependent enzyme [Clostridia bacterium]MBT7123204.1 aminotransferase class I/II-fold pyridoxal phosphate-dependent enzyme [Clostridia bacterium]